jgi:catechol 2,3-dioxygenase-like lactoylglutathione lyase family enzyme
MSTGLHPATQIGTVALTVSDLERSLAFYRTGVRKPTPFRGGMKRGTDV